MTNKKSIPVKTQKQIYQEANSQCAFCPEKNTDTLEIHHIYERANGGGNESMNLILVCANCHEKITVGSIPKADIIQKKYELMLKRKSITKDIIPQAKIFNISTTTNNGIIGETVNIKTQKNRLNILPPSGSIASDLHRRNYIKLLIDRYNEYKKADKTVGNFKYQLIYGAIIREFKCKWDLVPLSKFEELAMYLQSRIDKTILGRTQKSRGIKNYSTFEAFLNKMS